MKRKLRNQWGLNVLAAVSLLIVGLLLPDAQAQTVPVTGEVQGTIQGEADVSSLVGRLDDQQAQIDRLRSDVDALLDVATTPTPPPDTIPTPDPGSPTPKSTELWLNLSHYRFTPVIQYDADKDEYIITDPRFVELMSKWSGIRYLDWTGQLNRKVNWTWDNRVTAADADRWDSTGVPLEAIIAVANATHTHVWWTAPQQADLDYMRRAGELFAHKLDPNLKVVLEIGNEVWQSDRGWRYDELAGGDFGERMRLYAEDSAAKFAAFIDGPPDSSGFPKSRLTRVISGQLHNIGVLSHNALRHIDAGDYDAISCSGYFGNSPDPGSGSWRDGSGGLNASLAGLRAHAALARSVNKRLLIYELNQHINVGTNDLSFVDTDPVIDGVRTMIDAARNEGVGTIAIYAGVGNAYPGTPWPIYSKQYVPRRIVTELGWPTLN